MSNILLDASSTETYTGLCNMFNQNSSQQYLRDKLSWCAKTGSYPENHLFIYPLPFGIRGREILSHCRRLIEQTEDDGTALVGLHPDFQELIISCRSAYAEDERLIKDRSVHNDLFDSLRIGLILLQNEE